MKIHFRKRRKVLLGFTLIELLIAIGILSVLLSIVLIAVNPFEQINKANDVTTKASSKDLVSAVNYYFTAEKVTPWTKDTSCRSELTTGKVLTDMPSCAQDLTKGGKLQESVMASPQSKDIYVTECADAVAVCYHPKSQAFLKEEDAKYTKNGALQPGCPGGSGCYSCTFSTNDAQECFQALNPNGSLSLVVSPTPGQPIPIPERHSKDVCSSGGPGEAACMADVVTNAAGTPLTSLALPAGFGPAQIHTAYNLPCTPGGTLQSVCATPSSFGPRTIAIVDAYHSPTIEQDLAVYNQTYGLPPCTVTNGCLSIVNQNGTTSPMPSVNSLWALEIALDVQMAHAVCQTCKILVVETNSNYLVDLSAGVNRAALMGAHAISNSYGGADWAGETAYDAAFDHPGIFITASSGDWGYGTYHPASSSHVIAVGGTRLSLYPDNTYASETAWTGAGSGCSPYYTANAFQTAVSGWSATGCGTKRGVADVSAIADPNTGVAIYNSTSYNGKTGWWILGGTSVSSPIISAALVLQEANPANATQYVYDHANRYRDVASGSNGSCGGKTACTAAVGYDGPTGLGSPNVLPPANQTPVPTPTPIPPTATPTPIVSGPTPTPIPYALDDTKLLGSYAVFLYTDPGVPSPWMMDISFRPDFGGVVSQQKYNPTLYYDPDNGDTVLNAAYFADGQFGDSASATHIAFRKLTTKLEGFMSQPYLWRSYREGCGRTVYWRLFTNGDRSKMGPTQTGTIDCSTTVGVVDPPLSWYTVFDAVAQRQKYYEPLWDADNNGVIDYNDYVIMALKTKSRAGGWVPPEIPPSRYIVDVNNKSFTKVTNYSLTGKTPVPTCALGETTICPQMPIFSGSDAIGQCNIGTAVYAVFSSANCPGTVLTPTPTSVPTSTSTLAPPTPTPTTAPVSCNTQHTVSLSSSGPVVALPGDTVNNTLTIISNDTSGCSASYTISVGSPTGWTINGIPTSFTLAGGATKSIPFTISVPASAMADNYTYQFWVAKQGQTSVNPVNGYIQVAQVGPTNTPTPTPISCTQGWTKSLGSASMSGNGGDTINQSLTITNNNPAGCGSAVFTISYSEPSGWTTLSLPPSITLSGGQSTTIPFTITISTGALVGDYTTQYWINSGDTPVNATIHVLSTGTPPSGQMFSNFGGKFYGDYALFEFSYNMNGTGNFRLDVASDPSALNQTVGPNPLAYYGFAFTSGNAMDASNTATPTSVRGFIKSSPSATWSGWKCGSTIYYRMYNSGDLRIMSPIQSATVDCTTVVNVLPWDAWYKAIYYGVYDSRYDADNNGVVNWTDYWILVRATRLR
ncbi:MAG: prepilin-type N-terminal cleavage/methylation domain-containing protein [Candidatus Levyibacteriota bacterium]